MIHKNTQSIHLFLTLTVGFATTLTRFIFFVILLLPMKLRKMRNVLGRANLGLRLFQLQFGHFVLVHFVAIDLESVHDLVHLAVILQIRRFPHGIPILCLDGLDLLGMINDHAPFGQIANVQILGSNVGANVINDKVFG